MSKSEPFMGQRASGLRVSGKNLDIGEALRTQAGDRVAEVVSKYVHGGFSGHITVEKEGSGFRTECVIHLDSGATMNVSGVAHDAYASLNQAVERVAKQLRRDKRRRDARPNGNGAAPSSDVGIEADDDDVGIMAGDLGGELEVAEEDELAYASARMIVAEKPDALALLGLESAIAQLEQDGRDLLVFRNGGTGRVNVIHTRADGTIGWIDVPDANGGRTT